MQLARRPQPCVTFAGRQAAAPLGNSPLLPSRSRLPLGIVAKAKKTKGEQPAASKVHPPALGAQSCATSPVVLSARTGAPSRPLRRLATLFRR